MKLSFINTYLTVTVLLISVIACNPKEEIVPENPCANYKQPNADFIMEQTTGQFDNQGKNYLWFYNPDYPKDSIAEPTKINFRSIFTDTTQYKHTWYIGSQKFTTYKVWRDFYNVVPPNTYITIHHVLKWTPNTFCNPNDDGYDSVSFTFKLVDRYKEFNSFGKYRMVYDSVGAPVNQDSVDVEFYICYGNNKDSVVADPKFSDFFDWSMRIKGLYTVYPKGTKPIEGLVPSNTQPLPFSDGFLINSTMILIPLGSSFIDGFSLVIDSKKVAHLNYYNYSTPYKLKGRKIN